MWSWNKLPFRFDQPRDILLCEPRNSSPSNRANAVVKKSAPERPHRPLESFGRLGVSGSGTLSAACLVEDFRQ
jgi:hypothetical protein